MLNLWCNYVTWYYVGIHFDKCFSNIYVVLQIVEKTRWVKMELSTKQSLFLESLSQLALWQAIRSFNITSYQTNYRIIWILCLFRRKSWDWNGWKEGGKGWLWSCKKLRNKLKQWKLIEPCHLVTHLDNTVKHSILFLYEWTEYYLQNLDWSEENGG